MKEQKYCKVCGAMCSGKMLIEARGTKDYPVCTCCFARYRTTKLKDIRKLIRK